MRLMCVVLLLALMQSAGAQQQSSKMTLRCQGTSRLAVTSAELAFAPVTNLSIIVSGDDQTVSFLDNVVPITKVTPLASRIQQSVREWEAERFRPN